VFAKVAEELAELLGEVECVLVRDEGDGTAMGIATWGSAMAVRLPPGTRLPVDGNGVVASVLRAGRPCRIGDYSGVTGAFVEHGRAHGVSSAIGYPVVVGARVWGVLGAARYGDDEFPPETETQIAQFADLVATAIVNAEAREQVERLAQEQAALRRVATLVAQEASQAEVFAAIAEEIGHLLRAQEIRMVRFDGDRTAVVVASWGNQEAVRVGLRFPLGVDSISSRVFATGRPARIDDYGKLSGPVADQVLSIGVRTVVGVPVLVEGRLWGAMATLKGEGESLPPEIESRLSQFTDLMGTAIANTEARAQVERLAAEQAALRRVATLVAQGASPGAVLDAVAGEMEALLDADQVALNRFEPGGEILVLAHRGLDAARTPVGSRVSVSGESATAAVRLTGRPARMESYEGAVGPLAELARATGLRASVSAPIVVEGRLWGLITASWKGDESPPPDTEERMAEFAQLLDTAIANADGRDQLMASRARLVTEADDARRQVVRDLHDGAQQRLVHAIVTLKLALRALHRQDGEIESLIREALEQAEEGNAELRELAHGILPSVLTRGGLLAGIGSVVSRLDLPVAVDVPPERFPADVEASAYFIVAEALTNVMKHSRAGKADVKAVVENGMLCIEVRDDGVGGADPDGHGLVGIADRVTALGGRLEIESPDGDGTRVSAMLPLRAG
jgi:signal transduction histidine kinase